MRIFPWQRRDFFTAIEKEGIVEAIRSSEKRTSGEIRVFVESRCRYVDAIDRATELFFSLGMEKTVDRNAVLVYVAMKDKQLAVYGDEHIHQKVGKEYWDNTVRSMLKTFNRENYGIGLRDCVVHIGEALHYYFPYDNQTDKNELPDDIVFGR